MVKKKILSELSGAMLAARENLCPRHLDNKLSREKRTRTIPKNKTKTWVTDHIWTTGFTPQDVEPFHGSTYGPVQ